MGWTRLNGGRKRALASAAARATDRRRLSARLVLTATLLVHICLAATTAGASEYRYAVDKHPRRIAANAWHFVIRTGVRPAGELHHVLSQYDFASPTQGIAVDYAFNGPGMDYSDPRTFYAIAPTLFDPTDGPIDGWDVVDLQDGIFSGIVYSTARLTRVHLMIEADRLVRVRR